MLVHPRLKQLGGRIDQGRSLLRWVDLYAAQSLLLEFEKKGPPGKPDVSLVDLLVLCSACSVMSEVGVAIDDVASYQTLGLFPQLASSLEQAEVLSDSIELLCSAGLMQVSEFTQAPSTSSGCCDAEEGGLVPERATPLILSGGRLYLRRVWLQRESLERWVVARQLASDELTKTSAPRQGELHDCFTALFSSGTLTNETDWQAVAAIQALTQSFSLISGGPGTGKTSTAARIVLLLIVQHVFVSMRPAKVRLLAPTGKAAVRLHSAIFAQFDKLCDTLALGELERALVKKSFPEQGETIHRALLSVPGAMSDDTLSDRGAYHTSDALLLGDSEPAILRGDIVLIDEASMIDQSLMADLVAVLPVCRVVLLGDHFQLPPVEPGEIFSDWVEGFERQDYTPAQADVIAGYGHCLVARPDRLPDQGLIGDEHVRLICQLQKTYRFSGPIFEMAQALRGHGEWSIAELLPSLTATGRASGPEDLFEKAPLKWVDLNTKNSTSGGLNGHAESLLLDQLDDSLGGYARYFELVRKGADVQALAEEKERFQVLCSTYEGPIGAANINRMIEQRYAKTAGLYSGKVVMVTQNQADLALYNGDVGYLQSVDGVRHDQFVVVFPDKPGGELAVPLSLVRQWQSAYAISIHKSQGCEYERVLVIVPDYARELVSRRLVYTGITRSQKEVALWMSQESIGRLGGR